MKNARYEYESLLRAVGHEGRRDGPGVIIPVENGTIQVYGPDSAENPFGSDFTDPWLVIHRDAEGKATVQVYVEGVEGAVAKVREIIASNEENS